MSATLKHGRQASVVTADKAPVITLAPSSSAVSGTCAKTAHHSGVPVPLRDAARATGSGHRGPEGSQSQSSSCMPYPVSVAPTTPRAGRHGRAPHTPDLALARAAKAGCQTSISEADAMLPSLQGIMDAHNDSPCVPSKGCAEPEEQPDPQPPQKGKQRKQKQKRAQEAHKDEHVDPADTRRCDAKPQAVAASTRPRRGAADAALLRMRGQKPPVDLYALSPQRRAAAMPAPSPHAPALTPAPRKQARAASARAPASAATKQCAADAVDSIKVDPIKVELKSSVPCLKAEASAAAAGVVDATGWTPSQPKRVLQRSQPPRFSVDPSDTDCAAGRAASKLRPRGCSSKGVEKRRFTHLVDFASTASLLSDDTDARPCVSAKLRMLKSESHAEPTGSVLEVSAPGKLQQMARPAPARATKKKRGRSSGAAPTGRSKRAKREEQASALDHSREHRQCIAGAQVRGASRAGGNDDGDCEVQCAVGEGFGVLSPMVHALCQLDDPSPQCAAEMTAQREASVEIVPSSEMQLGSSTEAAVARHVDRRDGSADDDRLVRSKPPPTSNGALTSCPKAFQDGARRVPGSSSKLDEGPTALAERDPRDRACERVCGSEPIVAAEISGPEGRTGARTGEGACLRTAHGAAVGAACAAAAAAVCPQPRRKSAVSVALRAVCARVSDEVARLAARDGCQLVRARAAHPQPQPAVLGRPSAQREDADAGQLGARAAADVDAAEGDEEAWTSCQVLALQAAFRAIRPTAPNFWHRVAAKVPDKTACQCFEKYWGATAPSKPAPLRSARSATAATAAQAGRKLTAKQLKVRLRRKHYEMAATRADQDELRSEGEDHDVEEMIEKHKRYHRYTDTFKNRAKLRSKACRKAAKDMEAGACTMAPGTTAAAPRAPMLASQANACKAPSAQLANRLAGERLQSGRAHCVTKSKATDAQTALRELEQLQEDALLTGSPPVDYYFSDPCSD